VGRLFIRLAPIISFPENLTLFACLRGRNKAMASLVSIPDTLYRLDYVRPDLLFLRIVSRSLILWTDIEPSDVWVESQIPHLIRKLHNQFGSLAERRSGIAHLVKYPAFDSDDSSRNSFNKEDYYFLDKQLIRQSYAFILAGSCFSLGLRFAGSGNISAATVIRKRIFQFVELRDDNAPAKIAQRPDKQTIDMCLSTLAIALSLIMAGTGDIDSFRILRSLRWKCDETVKYGTHMAYGAAIGLLFLGGGSCTLGNSPADIAVLIASFFPRFPITTCDNQHHLQALRHLYALAVKRRLVDAFDVDSRESIFLPFEVKFIDFFSFIFNFHFVFDTVYPLLL
jgi:anaphase-promoting complex subunit 1